MPTNSHVLTDPATTSRHSTIPSRFIPSQLEVLREHYGLNKTEFLRRINLTRQGYKDLLSGAVRPNVTTIERIAGEFGMDIEYFFTRSGVTAGHHRT